MRGSLDGVGGPLSSSTHTHTHTHCQWTRDLSLARLRHVPVDVQGRRERYLSTKVELPSARTAPERPRRSSHGTAVWHCRFHKTLLANFGDSALLPAWYYNWTLWDDAKPSRQSSVTHDGFDFIFYLRYPQPSPNSSLTRSLLCP